MNLHTDTTIIIPDVSISDPSLALELDWLTHNDLCGSDHFPVILKLLLEMMNLLLNTLQWGAVDAGIEVPSGESTELKRSPFKVLSRLVYSHACCAYCQRFLPFLFLPFQSIHLHFFQNLSRFLLCWLWLTLGPCVGPQNRIGYPARGRFLC